MLLFGKPVYIDLNLGSDLPGSQFVFGNLARYVVRIGGGLRVRRNLQSIYVEKGQALYTALLRVDARLYKPGDDDPVAVGQFAT